MAAVDLVGMVAYLTYLTEEFRRTWGPFTERRLFTDEAVEMHFSRDLDRLNSLQIRIDAIIGRDD